MLNPAINIVLLDDHAILMDGLEALLRINQSYQVIGKFKSGQELLEQFDDLKIDLIIIDVNMKGQDGIDVFDALKNKGYGGKCIFLSSYDDLKLVNAAIDKGANGYISKASATKYLHEAIEHVMQNKGIYYSPDIKEKILNAFSRFDTNQAEYQDEAGVLRQLTEREIEVLRLIALQYTSEEIAKKLYIAKSTVDTHRKNLIHKLKVKNAVGLGLFAERNSLI